MYTVLKSNNNVSKQRISQNTSILFRDIDKLFLSNTRTPIFDNIKIPVLHHEIIHFRFLTFHMLSTPALSASQYFMPSDSGHFRFPQSNIPKYFPSYSWKRPGVDNRKTPQWSSFIIQSNLATIPEEKNVWPNSQRGERGISVEFFYYCASRVGKKKEEKSKEWNWFCE